MVPKWFVVCSFVVLVLAVSGVKSTEYDSESSAFIQQASDRDNAVCPPWSDRTTNGTCRCRYYYIQKHFRQSKYANIVWCIYNTASLPYCYCMSYNEEFNKTVVGYCNVRCHVHPKDPGRKVFTGVNRYQVIVNSYNLSEFNDETCRSLWMNRTGQMCGRCVKGYAPPVYSYSLACVNCTDYKYNWIKYIAVAYLPLTVFFVIVITFRISAASGAMNGYILISQVILSHTVLSLMYFSNKRGRVFIKIATTFYGIWNLDFFRSLYTPFCLHPNMTAIQTRALDYGVAVYPLLLVIITYIFASLHYRYSIIVSLWKPFYKCFRCLRKEWDIRNSLIGAFDTFILLSYVKILNISLDLLTPVTLYDVGYYPTFKLDQLYLNMDGSVKYFGKEHLPYAILAIVMALVFNILPLLLLCLFPSRCCFHRCLNFFHIRRETLREFVAVFLCEFRDQPRDYRYFASFYLFLRIINLLVLFLCQGNMFFLVSAAFFAVSAILTAAFKPYRKPLHNYMETVLWCVAAVMCLASPAYNLAAYSANVTDFNFLRLVWFVIISFHPLYGVCVLVCILLPTHKFKESFSYIKAKIYSLISSEPEDRPPYRLDHMDEYPPLLPHVEPRDF